MANRVLKPPCTVDMNNKTEIATEFLELIEITLLCDEGWKSQTRSVKSEDYRLGYGQAVYDVAHNLIGGLKNRLEKEQNNDGE